MLVRHERCVRRELREGIGETREARLRQELREGLVRHDRLVRRESREGIGETREVRELTGVERGDW